MKKKTLFWIFGIAFALLFFCGASVFFGVVVFNMAEGKSTFVSDNSVAIVRVEGVIQSGDAPVDVFGSSADGAYSNNIIRQLKAANDDPKVKAVVLRVNSPGGGVVASDEIYEQMIAMNKPVVVSMGTMAASGGYYVSAPADEIWANRHTLTGSIGVIIQFINIAGFMEEYGIGANAVTSGVNKDTGSMYREMTDDELAIWQGIIDDAYNIFVDIIVEGRGLDEETVRTLADGRVYTGNQALDLGLVDHLGNLDDVIQRAAELGGIEGEPNVVDFSTEPSIFPDLFGSLQQKTPATELQELLKLDTPPLLMYLYSG